MRSRTLAGRWVLWTVVVLGALVMLFPFLWTVVTSISTGAGLDVAPSLIPHSASFAAYLELFRRTDFGRVVLNSLVIAVGTVALQILTSALAAYVFSRLPFRGRGVVFGFYLATMMVPMQVLLVPLFVEMKSLGLVNTYLGVILPAMASAFGVFLLRQAMSTVPYELDEAARLDGAGHLRIFGQVLMPLVTPAVATLGVFSFMNSWNAFLWPLVILRSPQLKTLPLALAALQGQYTTRWDVVMAGSVITILPMVAVYVFAQKYVVQSVAGTGLK